MFQKSDEELSDDIEKQAMEYIQSLEETIEILEKEIERLKKQIYFRRFIFGAFVVFTIVLCIFLFTVCLENVLR